jgi:hypothetical protein
MAGHIYLLHFIGPAASVRENRAGTSGKAVIGDCRSMKPLCTTPAWRREKKRHGKEKRKGMGRETGEEQGRTNTYMDKHITITIITSITEQ